MAYHLNRIGFQLHSVYRLKPPSVAKIAKQKISFLIASFTLFAFVVGNMVGQHGWYAFWKTVLGKEEQTIAYVGTVTPIEKVPDYRKWIAYGGSPEQHTYRMVPQDLLVPLPAYNPSELQGRGGDSLAQLVYSVAFLGSYTTGADHSGRHAGVDIRVPPGTPIRSIANGFVESTSMQEYGFGHHVVIRHPNVPDPLHPGKTTTIYSVYAHLDAILVTEGQMVHKGETIASSGKSGDVTGPHLHFQIDTADAPYRPYWPFTSADLRAANLSLTQAMNSTAGQAIDKKYTISPLLFVQAHLDDTASTIAQNTPSPQNVVTTPPRRILTPAEKRAQRLETRIARVAVRRPVVASTVPQNIVATQPVPVSSVVTVAEGSTSTVVRQPTGGSNTDVHRVALEHSGKLENTWQKLTVRALDRNGSTVINPSFPGKIYIITEFGEAVIRPSEITAADFEQGVATVNVLTRGTKTTIFATRGAFTTSSAPLVHER